VRRGEETLKRRNPQALREAEIVSAISIYVQHQPRQCIGGCTAVLFSYLPSLSK
jgi:hypothetical protein